MSSSLRWIWPKFCEGQTRQKWPSVRICAVQSAYINSAVASITLLTSGQTPDNANAAINGASNLVLDGRKIRIERAKAERE